MSVLWPAGVRPLGDSVTFAEASARRWPAMSSRRSAPRLTSHSLPGRATAGIAGLAAAAPPSPPLQEAETVRSHSGLAHGVSVWESLVGKEVVDPLRSGWGGGRGVTPLTHRASRIPMHKPRGSRHGREGGTDQYSWRGGGPACWRTRGLARCAARPLRRTSAARTGPGRRGPGRWHPPQR